MQAESSLHRSLSESYYPTLKDEPRRGIEQALGYSILPPIEPTYPISLPDHASSQSQDYSAEFLASPAAMFLSGFAVASPTATALPDDEGQVVSGYTLGPIVGNGASSIIRKATSLSGGIVAVKIVRLSNLDRAELRQLENEHQTWASLSHEHILPLFSAEQTSYAYFFVTQYCPAGSLFDILKRDGTPALPQDDAGMMFRQVVRGLRHLHEVAGLVHRDIKLENVLVDEMGVCRITDFGFAKKYEGPNVQGHEHAEDEMHASKSAHLAYIRQKSQNPRHRSSTPAQLSTAPTCTFQPGSLPYAAPELLSSQECPLDPAQDIWALGVLLYTLLTGNFPFKDSFEPRLQLKILRGTYDVPTNIGRGAERVLSGCLRLNIEDRWSIAMVDEVAWGVGWGDVHHDEESFVPSPSRSRSRPAHRDPWNLSPIEERDMYERPQMGAAQRRSSSRAERSRSRAPTSRQSRSSSIQPALSAIPGALLRAMSTSSSASSSASTSSFRTAETSRERGRRPTKTVYDEVYIASRSNSPIAATSPQTGRAMALVRDIHTSQLERGRRAHAHADDDKHEDVFPGHWPSPAEPRSISRGRLFELPSVGRFVSWMRGEHLQDNRNVSRRSGSVPPIWHGSLGTSTPTDPGLRSRSVARN